MRTLGCWLSLLGMVSALAVSSFADGKVFPRSAYAAVEIPDQRALIYFADGVQTLVVETSFAGEGSEFAWVVPLPSVPTVAPVSSAVFRTLEFQFQPRVITKPVRWWLWILCGAGAAALVLFLWENPRHLPVVIGFGFLALLAAGSFIPARSTAGAGGPPASSVKVLNQEHAGIFEVTTISSSSATDLIEWLTEHGFGLPPGVEPVVADYVKEGWVFVAAKIRKEAEAPSSASIHPLAYTFPAERAVYPLRLTGVGNGTCRVDLYVFGPSRAEASGFQVEHCERPVYENFSTNAAFHAGARIRQEELRELVKKAPVATRLSGALTSREMEQDAYITWSSYRPARRYLYTPEAAVHRTANYATAAAIFGLLGTLAAGRRLRWDRSTLLRRQFLVLGGAAAVAVLVFVTTRRVEAEAMNSFRASKMMALSHLKTVAFDLGIDLELSMKRKAETRGPIEIASELLPGMLSESRLKNFFTGEPIRLEASPGNLLLREVEDGLAVIWHDADGAEALTQVISLKRAEQRNQ